jgi:exonuclease III
MPWSVRKEKLAERMVQLDPDCICLQEVEKFQEIQECMERHGYRGIFSQRNNGQEEGCAIFYKHLTFDVIASGASYFNDGTGRMIQHAEIRPKSGADSFHLLNTHTIWHTSFQDKRLKEIQDLENLASLKSQNERPVIVCGDLNTARHEREVFQGFFENGFEDTLVTDLPDKNFNALILSFLRNGM